MSADLEALVPEMARLDAFIEAEMRRMRARYELSLDEFHGLYISDDRVEALLRTQPPVAPAAAPDISAPRASDRSSRWHQLADAVPLDDDERDLLLVCLAPEIDSKYETLYAYLNDDVTKRWPTPELAIRLFSRSVDHRARLRGCLLPAAPLLAVGAVDMPSLRDEPRGKRLLRIARPLADWVQGLAYADERLIGVARFGAFDAVIPDAALPAAARAVLNGLVQRFREQAPVPPVVLSAATATEAALVAEDLFARAGRPALVVDLAALRTAPAPADVVAALDLAQRVLRLGIVAAPLEALLDHDGRIVDACAPAVRRLAGRSPALVLARGPNVRARDVVGDTATVDLVLPETTADERAAAWRGALADAWKVNAVVVPDALVTALADRFALGADRIVKAAYAARDAAMLDGAPQLSGTHTFAAARAGSADGSGGTTRTVTTVFDWDDLVLPGDVKGRLADVVHAIECRSRVLDEWDFARRVGGARGIKVMFAGPSGTGKTMAAAIVAKTLQLDLQRLELGTVVSKYIGETEKNLDRAFEAARRANAVLFIDEADALLGKRSQVKDAHDRYANVEIAYLLQKMEDHDGIVIVATNLAQNIDEAFSRRMQYVIEFPQPDATARERLWRGMFPSAAPLSDDVDFTFLGRQFELAGGDIRNIVLDTAYRAAQDESAITLGHLLRAVARQYAKRGKVPTTADFREHYFLLFEDDRAATRAPALPAS